MDFYEKSKKVFQKIISDNFDITREEWDKYAQENCLFSSITLMAHADTYTFENLKIKMGILEIIEKTVKKSKEEN